jgi:hypothetical protein
MTTELTWIGQAAFLLRTPATRLAPELHPGGRVAVLAGMAGTPLRSLVGG